MAKPLPRELDRWARASRTRRRILRRRRRDTSSKGGVMSGKANSNNSLGALALRELSTLAPRSAGSEGKVLILAGASAIALNLALASGAAAQSVGVTVGANQNVTNNNQLTANVGIEFTGDGGT